MQFILGGSGSIVEPFMLHIDSDIETPPFENRCSESNGVLLE